MGEVPKCLPCALPGSTHLHSATRTSCDTAGTGRIPNLIHQMEFLPPESRTDLLGLTAHMKRLHSEWYTSRATYYTFYCLIGCTCYRLAPVATTILSL